MNSAYFITGTDTDVGKTWTSVALMLALQQQGKRVIGMKPVAAGCEIASDGQLLNADALLLQAHSSIAVDYALINPYAYLLPISPHLAGADNPVQLDVIANCFQQLQSLSDVVLVEGAGGWYSPINNNQANSDIAHALALPVILVVGIKLGCINHACLSYQAIVNAGLECVGWVAACNQANLLNTQDTIDSVQSRLAAPLLGVLPYLEQADFALLARQLIL
jgi:dethiobiotin synthetase